MTDRLGSQVVGVARRSYVRAQPAHSRAKGSPALPTEQPNITPLAGLAWADPTRSFVVRLARAQAITFCVVLAGFGLGWAITRDPWQAIGFVVFLYGIATVQVIFYSIRAAIAGQLSWGRLAMTWLVHAAVAAAAFLVALQVVLRAT